MAASASALLASCLIAASPAGADPGSAAPDVRLQPRLIAMSAVATAWASWETGAGCISNAQDSGSWTGCPGAGLAGPDISDVMNRLDRLDAQITANQRELLSRFDNLDRALTEIGVQEALEGQLTEADRTSQDADQAWRTLVRCLERRAQGATTCQPWTGRLGPEQAIESALDQTRQHFQSRTDVLRQRVDLLPLVSACAGTGRATGLLPLAWRHYKGI